MIKEPYYRTLRLVFRLAAWLRFNRKFQALIVPEQVIFVCPDDIAEKPVAKPHVSRLTFSSVVGGDWDESVERVEDDIVYRSFVSHFIHGVEWQDTPYFAFLRTKVSEHGGKTDDEIRRRCEKLDQLYDYIRTFGFKRQDTLESESGILIESWKHKLIPPEFREVSIHIARDGRLLWNGGFHRLCIAKILGLEEIPVRVSVRHFRWQETRDTIARGDRVRGSLSGHPDIRSMRCRQKTTGDSQRS